MTRQQIVHKAFKGAFGSIHPHCRVEAESLLMRFDWQSVTCKNCLKQKDSIATNEVFAVISEAAVIMSHYEDGDTEGAQRLYSQATERHRGTDV